MKPNHLHELNKALLRANAMLFRRWTAPAVFDGSLSSWHLAMRMAQMSLERAAAIKKEINQQNHEHQNE